MYDIHVYIYIIHKDNIFLVLSLVAVLKSSVRAH